jgi:hypothetical protein
MSGCQRQSYRGSGLIVDKGVSSSAGRQWTLFREKCSTAGTNGSAVGAPRLPRFRGYVFESGKPDRPLCCVSVLHRAHPVGPFHLVFRVPSARAGCPWRFKNFGMRWRLIRTPGNQPLPRATKVPLTTYTLTGKAAGWRPKAGMNEGCNCLDMVVSDAVTSAHGAVSGRRRGEE